MKIFTLWVGEKTKPIQSQSKPNAGFSSEYGGYFPCAAGRASLEYAKISFGFIVIETNAIAVYMAVQLINFRNIGGVFVRGLEKYSGNWYPLIYALAGFTVVWLILWWMYRKKTFIKI